MSQYREHEELPRVELSRYACVQNERSTTDNIVISL